MLWRGRKATGPRAESRAGTGAEITPETGGQPEPARDEDDKTPMTASIAYKGKTIYDLPVSRSPDIPSVFFMSVHKSGSTLMNNMIRAACEMLEYEFVDIQSHFFNTGISDADIPADTSAIFKPQGYVYSGFRYFPNQYEIPCLNDCPLIVLVRDPRDAVVSQYFSLSQSHPMPGKDADDKLYRHMEEQRKKTLGSDINEFALREVGSFVKKLETYSELLKTHPKARLFQYEEIIYMKKKWIMSMLNFLEWQMKPGQPMSLANRFNVVPKQEDASKHIRQVHPQNYMTKLSPETIAEINRKYSATLLRYNYI
ncbi:sulfotransferase domain-containing protein [Mameliella alba]|uniref:sulfotransferase domain-containing protein n=1 Tax=Mameliella alba TaxID=561184 RepID=UPI0012FFB4A5|nr:sulfotransferase domain-containing protein [Mameliella alba]